MTKKQGILAIPLEEQKFGIEDFIISLCNMDAYNALLKQTLWPNNRLLILGEAGSGKSHLAGMWSKQVSAHTFSGQFEELYTSEHSSILAEDIDMLENDHELFHLINYCTTERITLLMTAKAMPTPSLRDLKSRLNATHKVVIKAPDDELVKILLHKYFTTNQIKVDTEVFDYLSTRVERSFSAISRVARLLNEMSLEQQRAITVPFAREVLEKLSRLS